MRVLREKALELLTAVGFSGVNRWNKEKTLRRLLALVDTELDEKTLTDEQHKLLDAIAGSNGNVEIVLAEEDLAEPDPVEDDMDDDADDVADPSDVEEDADETVPVKPPKEKKAKKEKAPKPPKEKKPRSGGTGVRHVKSRLYYAGAVLKKCGLDKGITNEQVEEVEALLGKEEKNPRGTRWCLVQAWHVLDGYQNEVAEE